MTDFDYDFFVIGGGSGGVRAARVAASLGARVALAEENRLGGTCVNVGCIPKKLFSYAAHYAQDFHDAAGYGWEIPSAPQLNWDSLRDGKDTEIARLNNIYRALLENTGVTVYDSRAVVVDQHTVKVEQGSFTAKEILVATGGWPFMPDIPGIELALDSNDMFALKELPTSILIVGGGYIAVEFAGILAGLGVEVTVCHRGPAVLRGFDTEIAAAFALELQSYAKVLPSTEATAIRKQGDLLAVSLSNGSELQVGAVLFATGRKPNARGIGLEDVGVKFNDKGAILVDEHYTTRVANIHAVGDVIDRLALTPIALAEGQIVARRLFGEQTPGELNYDLVATAVFSQPPISTVGMDEETARKTLGEVDVYRSRFTPLKHTMSGRLHKVFIKMIVDKATDRVVGLHMLGDDSAEIIQGMAVAMTAGATKAMFDATIGIHPTAAEEFVTLRVPS